MFFAELRGAEMCLCSVWLPHVPLEITFNSDALLFCYSHFS